MIMVMICYDVAQVGKRQLDTYGSPAADPQIDSYGPPNAPICQLQVIIIMMVTMMMMMMIIVVMTMGMMMMIMMMMMGYKCTKKDTNPCLCANEKTCLNYFLSKL